MKRIDRPARESFQGWMFLVLLGIALVWGCGDDDNGPSTFDPPGNLTYINGDGQITLSWTASSAEGGGDFAGYDVFRDTATMIGLNLADLAGRKLNATPLTVRSYVDATPVNGTKYYYALRSVKTDENWSAPTAEIDTSPVTKGGLVLLAEFADAARASGFDFSEGVAVSVTSRADNRMLVDVYVGTEDVNDASDQQLALKSPHLVNGGDPDWSARIAQLKLLDDEDDPTTENSGWQDNILLGTTEELITSKVIAVRTPPDGAGQVHYGKITVYATSGPAGQRQIEVFYTFQQIANYIRF
jgi:hypothetical protein